MFWWSRLRRPPRTPYQFFIARGVLGEVVVLGDGHVDDLVGVDERREDRPLVEDVALEAHRAEAVLLREHHLGAERRRPRARCPSAGSSGSGRCTSRRRRRPSSRPASNASLMTARDDVGVRVRGVDGHAVPADVRLDDDDVAARDELAHPAHRVDRAAHELLRRRRRVGRVVAGLLGGGAGDGQLGVLGVARRRCGSRAPGARALDCATSKPPWSQRARAPAARRAEDAGHRSRRGPASRGGTVGRRRRGSPTLGSNSGASPLFHTPRGRPPATLGSRRGGAAQRRMPRGCGPGQRSGWPWPGPRISLHLRHRVEPFDVRRVVAARGSAEGEGLAMMSAVSPGLARRAATRARGRPRTARSGACRRG